MAETIKVLGQESPSANTLIPLYQAPDEKSAVCSSLVACNRGDERTTFRISIAVDDASDSVEQYQFYDVVVDGNRSYIATIGWTLGGFDVVRCQSGNGLVSFGLFGVEKS